MITGKFEKGDRGQICRRPSDGGAWVVPDRRATVELGVEYVLEVVGTIPSGKLRFARAVETVAARRERCIAMITAALADVNQLTGWYVQNIGGGVTMAIEGEKIVFEQVGRVGEGDQRNWLKGPKWFPKIRITGAALNAIRKAWLACEAERERERQGHVVLAEKSREEAEVAHAAQIVKDAEFVQVFFADHPEAAAWFSSASLTFDEVTEQAIKHGLAARLGEAHCVGAYSYHHKRYEQKYVLVVGGKEIIIVHLWDDDGGDD